MTKVAPKVRQTVVRRFVTASVTKSSRLFIVEVIPLDIDERFTEVTESLTKLKEIFHNYCTYEQVIITCNAEAYKVLKDLNLPNAIYSINK